ncbi:MAG: beta-lactamase family protein [Bacteroidales bacterium]|nr:beta-lactamase family protein [Bacteroidales bacterium]MCF8344709.1 beta-lactamase family protein [Bacteroidales bacterium]MCF8349784.1 beta-lactamase family protein [Bacteroidales bacterium]MCF8376303.1 beta-lactamase family protein [Bacteroidales bacterium]MCF8400997.1 beta-lactamase family protein [Bacteroidales bacterium]
MKQSNCFVYALLLTILLMNACRKADKSFKPEPTPSEKTENTIKAVLDSVIDHTHVPGLVAGVWAPNEGIDVEYAAGVANVETQEPMSTDMIFRIGSNTKTITVTVLLQLVDEGLINLNDKLSDYLPDFPRADEVTIEMLTNMRSGIYSFTDSDSFINTWTENPTKYWHTDSLIKIAASHPYYFDPGTGFHYSNSNTVIIGKIIKMVSGASLEANIHSRIVNALGLINTMYMIAGTELPGFHSCAYFMGYYDAEYPEYSESIDISWANAAGSAISTLYELKIYVESLANGYFLSENLQEKRMICHEMHAQSEVRYGMGILTYKGFYGHNGGLPGYSSLMVNSPERNCTIIVWYNCKLDNSDPTSLLKIIPGIIYPEIE